MLLFNAKFAVSKDLSRQIFLDMLLSHVIKSGDYRFEVDVGLDITKNREYEAVSADRMHKFILYVTDEQLAIQISRQNDSSISTDTYILANADDTPVMSVQLDRSLCCLSVPSMRDGLIPDIPYVVRDLFWQEYGGVDHGIEMSDGPYRIRKKNIDFVKSIFSHEIELFNPIIYVAVNRKTGEYPVDCYALSFKTIGLGHVFVEDNPYVADKLSLDILSEDGGVFLLFPNGDTHVIYDCNLCDGYDSEAVIYNVVKYLCRITSSMVIDDMFSFPKIQMAHVLSKSNDNDDLSKVCDELLKDKDMEITELKRCLAEVRSSLSSAESKIDSMTQAFADSKKGQTGKNIVFAPGTESELYPNEFKDIILKLISKEVITMDGDSKLVKSRKFHALSSILKANELTGYDQTVSNGFCKALENGTLTPESLSEIERLGFSVSRSRNSHYRVAYNGDVRYSYTIASSPSDFRAGENLGKSYMNMLFGF